MRADVYLCVNGFCESRQKAKYLIENGFVTSDGKLVKKASEQVDGKCIVVTGTMKYVGRGGFKLEVALSAFGVDVSGRVCVDIGASTGGFTDCLLLNGAKKVFCIDSGSSQLHPSLVSDSRVVNIENFNARNLTSDVLCRKADIAVMDVSFISQTLLYDAVNGILSDDGVFLSLIKPQFENDASALSKGGIVKKRLYHERTLDKIIAVSYDAKLFCHGIIVSPIKGGDGNIEYLAIFKRQKSDKIIDVKSIVTEAFSK